MTTLEIAKRVVTRDEFELYCVFCRVHAVGLGKIPHKPNCLIEEAKKAIAAEESATTLVDLLVNGKPIGSYDEATLVKLAGELREVLAAADAESDGEEFAGHQDREGQ